MTDSAHILTSQTLSEAEGVASTPITINCLCLQQLSFAVNIRVCSRC